MKKRIRTAYFREYARKNREKVNAYGRALYAKGGEAKRAKKIEQSKRSKAKHLEARRAGDRKAKQDWKARDYVGALLAQIKGRAKRRGLPFDLARSDIQIPARCPILGIPLMYGVGVKLHAGTPTVDRIDNYGGYTKSNIVIISWRANRIKCDATAAELRAIADFYGALS